MSESKLWNVAAQYTGIYSCVIEADDFEAAQEEVNRIVSKYDYPEDWECYNRWYNKGTLEVSEYGKI